MVMQIRRTSTPNNPPVGLLPGQLSVEMANTPPRLWTGVPTNIDPLGRRELLAGGGGGATSVTQQVNLRGERVTNSAYRFAVDEIVFAGSGTFHHVRIPTDLTCDIDVLGAGGRDQLGPFASAGWIHFFWIYNQTMDQVATLCSVSSSNPILPPGFTHFCYIGAVYLTAVLAFRNVVIRGMRFFYPDGAFEGSTQIVNNGHIWANVLQAVNFAAFVPPEALTTTMYYMVVFWTRGEILIGVVPTPATFSTIFISRIFIGSEQNTGFVEIPNRDQTLYFAGYSSTDVPYGARLNSLNVNAYTVPNGAI